MDGKISVIDHYTKTVGRGLSVLHVVFTMILCSTNFFLARYIANIHKLGSNSFSQPVQLINSKPDVLKCAKAHDKNYTKVRPSLVSHIQHTCLLSAWLPCSIHIVANEALQKMNYIHSIFDE